MMKRYKQLLTYIKSAVTRNYSEKSINSILDYISTSKQMELLQDFYETTLEALKEAKNERLWFKTNTKLGKLYFDRGDYSKLQKILKQLHLSCQVRFSPVLLWSFYINTVAWWLMSVLCWNYFNLLFVCLFVCPFVLYQTSKFR